MNRFQLEKLYEVNGLSDYKLRDTVDLLKTHGIDFTEVNGYSMLDNQNKQLFKEFIVNYYNGYGLDIRETMVPKGIYYVEDVEYLVKEDPDDEGYTVIGGKVTAIDSRTNAKHVLRSWQDESYANQIGESSESMMESKPKQYLRFEYEINGHSEWQHVIDPKTWY